MNRAFVFIPIALTLIFASTIHIIFAVSYTHSIPNTSSKYCSSGKCLTNSTYQTNYNSSSQRILFHGSNGTIIHNMPFVGVQLSKTCLKLIESNVTSHCMSYHYLKKFDNTNPTFYGQWAFFNGYYHRLAPLVKQSWIFVSNKPLVYVDPDPEFTTRAKMIIVQPDNFTWINPNENGTNTKIIIHVNRFVDSICDNAQVAPIDSLINDTIRYMIGGCKITSYNDTKYQFRSEIGFDYDTVQVKSLNYLHQFNNHTKFIQNCIFNKCNNVNPFTNHDKQFGW